MSITQCPRCEEKVTVPSAGQRDARVRCPLCQEEYLLSEALDKLPPTLILLDASVDEYEFADTSKAHADELSLEPVAAVGGFGFDSAAAVSTAAAKSATIRATPRSKRKPKSAVVEGLKIVIGGAMGLVIAQLILFWIPIANLGRQQRDPANLAPKIARFAPFLLPEHLRPKSLNGDSGATNDNGKSVAKNGKPNKIGSTKTSDNPFSDRNDKIEPLELPVPGIGDLSPDSDDKGDLLFPRAGDTKKKGNDEPALDIGLPDLPRTGTPANEPKPDAGARSKDTARAKVTVPRIPSPDDSVLPKPNEPKPASQETAPAAVLLDAPSFSADDVAVVREAFQDANEAWSQSDDQDRDAAKKLKAAFYHSFARLAEVATFADTQDADAMLQVRQVLAIVREISGQAKQMELIDKIAAGWLGKTDRPNNGIVLVGTVVESSAAATVVEIPAKEPRLVTVVPYRAGGSRVPVGSRILVLGAIVDDPATALESYSGDAAPIVLETLHFVIPEPTDEKPATDKSSDQEASPEKTAEPVAKPQPE